MQVSRIHTDFNRLDISSFTFREPDRERPVAVDHSLILSEQLTCPVITGRHQRDAGLTDDSCHVLHPPSKMTYVFCTTSPGWRHRAGSQSCGERIPAGTGGPHRQCYLTVLYLYCTSPTPQGCLTAQRMVRDLWSILGVPVYLSVTVNG